MFTSASHTLDSAYQNECSASNLEYFDLNKPVKVTVIIDDDFDISPSIPQDNNNNSKNKNTRPRKRARPKNKKQEIIHTKQTLECTENLQTKDNTNEITSTPLFINLEHNSVSINNSFSNYVHKAAVHPLDIILYDILDIIKFYFTKRPFCHNQNYYESFKTIKFSHSYEYVLKYLIPIEHNDPVLNNFIMRITTIAKDYSFPIVFNQSRYLLLEMIKWCKDKSMTRPPPYNVYPIFMAENPSSVSNHINMNKLNQIESALNNEEVRINVDQELHNLCNNPNKDICNGSQNSVNSTQSLSENSDILPQHGSVFPTTFNQDTRCDSHRYPTVQSLLNSNGERNIFENDSLENRNNDTIYRPEIVIQLDINQQVEATRCTISTDSGFTSPLTFNFSDEFTVINKEPQTEVNHEDMMPIIENVTSLNTTVKLGACNVCKKTTHKMCKGCYKIFYCSIECMKAEWQLHKFFCCQPSGN
ncbi:uncharacterized protein LOC119830972 [Zerene cesonia]|uniref:uncharacterized protein LOC119830972 n=1 Tax=Zerene cesonia TaxID=33412 RepID=UPI0018E56C73|nr:uncharacterized protein LOC119830972 [Zerene cesonia]